MKLGQSLNSILLLLSFFSSIQTSFAADAKNPYKTSTLFSHLKEAKTRHIETPTQKFRKKNHQQWLNKANEDLLAARALLEKELFATSIYHCHQAAEKAFKAYLSSKGQSIDKIHDLVELVHQCADLNKKFKSLIRSATFLNQYGYKLRYPPENDADEECADDPLAMTALTEAQDIINFVQIRC